MAAGQVMQHVPDRHRRNTAACVVLILCGFSLAAAAAVRPGNSGIGFDQEQVSQLIVKLRRPELAGTPLPEAVLSDLSARAEVGLSHVRPMAGGAHVLRLPERQTVAQAQALSARLTRHPDVEYAVADRRKQPLLTPDDSYFNQQWHYQDAASVVGAANLPGAWDITTGDPSIIVAVIDTGLLSHADIDADIHDGSGRVVPGYDFIGDLFTAADGDGRDPDPSDPGDTVSAGECEPGSDPASSSWHGTHVAGTIGALSNNALGVAGVTWGARIQSVRVLGKCGGFTSDIIDGMAWAAGLAVPGVPDNPTPARVLNLSLGGGGTCSAAEQAAIDAIVAEGVVVVVAAGNDNVNAGSFSPASCKQVITVSAHDRAGQRAVYSNYGSVVEISAPGGDFEVDTGILSTYDGGASAPAGDNSYAFLQGTSMAAPHVAGIVALMLSLDASQTPAGILSWLQSTVRPFPRYGNFWDCTTESCGAGMVDAAQALAALSSPDTTPAPFAFADQSAVEPGSPVTSAPISITGINTAAPISVANGEYALGCTSNYTSANGTILNGQTVCVRHTAASAYLTATTTTLTVGGVSDQFTSTTRDKDSTPNSFSFAPAVDVEPGEIVTSNAVSISGMDDTAPIHVVDGEYSIGCTGSFTATSASIAAGDTVCVRHQAAGQYNDTAATTLIIGDVAGDFVSVTRPPPPGTKVSGGGGGGGALSLLGLLPLLFAVRWRS